MPNLNPVFNPQLLEMSKAKANALNNFKKEEAALRRLADDPNLDELAQRAVKYVLAEINNPFNN